MDRFQASGSNELRGNSQEAPRNYSSENPDFHALLALATSASSDLTFPQPPRQQPWPPGVFFNPPPAYYSPLHEFPAIPRTYPPPNNFPPSPYPNPAFSTFPRPYVQQAYFPALPQNSLVPLTSYHYPQLYVPNSARYYQPPELSENSTFLSSASSLVDSKVPSLGSTDSSYSRQFSVLLPSHNVRLEYRRPQPFLSLASTRTITAEQMCGSSSIRDVAGEPQPRFKIEEKRVPPPAPTLPPFYPKTLTPTDAPTSLTQMNSKRNTQPASSMKASLPKVARPPSPKLSISALNLDLHSKLNPNDILVIFEVDRRRVPIHLESGDEKVSFIREKLEELGHTDQSLFRIFHGRDLEDHQTFAYYGIKGGDKVILKEKTKFSQFHEKLFHWDKLRFGKRKQQGSTPLKSNELIHELSDLLDSARKAKDDSVFITRYNPLKESDFCEECQRKNDRFRMGRKPCSECGMSELFMLSCPSSLETRRTILEVFLPPHSRLFHLVSANYLRWLALGHKTITYLETLSFGITGRVVGKGDVRLLCFSLRYKCPRQARDAATTPALSDDICFNLFSHFDFGKYFDHLASAHDDPIRSSEKKKYNNLEHAENMRKVLNACDQCDSMKDPSKNFWVTDVWNQAISLEMKNNFNVKETFRKLFFDFCATNSLDDTSFFLVVKIPKDESDDPFDHESVSSLLDLPPQKKRKLE